MPVDLRTTALAVDGAHGPLLQPTTLRAPAGRAVLVSGDPGHGHTAFALALAGRLVPSGGQVLVDGRAVPALAQRAVALVDTPGVSEPDDVLPLRSVVAEGLAMAGRRARRSDVGAWLDERGASELGRTRVEQLAPEVRTALLADLAVLRPDVQALVLTLPDRHGARPQTWWRLARRLAAGESDGRQRTVVVTCTRASAELLGVPHADLGTPEDPR